VPPERGGIRAGTARSGKIKLRGNGAAGGGLTVRTSPTEEAQRDVGGRDAVGRGLAEVEFLTSSGSGANHNARASPGVGVAEGDGGRQVL
jgi:hypothetical protein